MNRQRGRSSAFITSRPTRSELGTDGLFTETTPYAPNSPYSASKASSDHLVRAWRETHGLPTVVTNCSNNYGSKHSLVRFIFFVAMLACVIASAFNVIPPIPQLTREPFGLVMPPSSSAAVFS